MVPAAAAGVMPEQPQPTGPMAPGLAGDPTPQQRRATTAAEQAVAAFLRSAQLKAIAPLPGSALRR